MLRHTLSKLRIERARLSPFLKHQNLVLIRLLDREAIRGSGHGTESAAKPNEIHYRKWDQCNDPFHRTPQESLSFEEQLTLVKPVIQTPCGIGLLITNGSTISITNTELRFPGTSSCIIAGSVATYSRLAPISRQRGFLALIRFA